MARNGSGTYNRIAGTPYVYNTVIDQAVVNSEFDDIATALTNSIAKDGQTTPTADLPMGTYKHTGVGAATARTQYARAAEVQDGSITHLTSVAGTDIITASAALSMIAYVVGQSFEFIPPNTNTGATTLNINSIGAGAVQLNGAELARGTIRQNVPVRVKVTATTPVFEIIGNGAFVPRSGGGLVGPLNTARATVASAATTADIWAAAGNEIDWTGTTTCTGFPAAPQAGASRILHLAAAAPFTAGANMLIDGTTSGNTITLAANDIVTVHAITTTQFRIEIKKYDGRPVVSTSTSAGLFYKADPSTVAFTKTGAGAAEIKAGTKVDVSGTLVEFSAATAITMPTLTAGTDYAIWVKTDGTIQADASFTSAPGAGTWRKIGGFHYAPGGNATGTSGGDTTPAINAYSFWDVKFRPACPDPRGMALVADSFWTDIYLCGVDHHTNGTSKYNVTIADGSSPPKIPAAFGGNGTAAYSTLNFWEAAEVLHSHGKRMPTYDEFAALAYGTTEASSGGTDPTSTILREAYTSKWGVMLATGNMLIWGANFGGGAAAASWTANTGGRGSTYQMENAAIFGGQWGSTSYSGSRTSDWSNSPSASGNTLSARGVCDHLIIE